MQTNEKTWKGYLSEKHREALLHLRVMFLRYLLDRSVGGRGSVDEIRELVPVGVNPKILGMVPRGLPLTCLGWKTNQNKETHGRPIRLWALTSREAADQWLRDHQTQETCHAAVASEGTRDHSDRGESDHAGPPSGASLLFH